MRAAVDAAVFGSSIRLGGSVAISESSGSSLQMSAAVHATLPQPIGQRSWSFSFGSRRRQLKERWNTPVLTQNATLASSPWTPPAASAATPRISELTALNTAATDPCTLHSSASLDIGGVIRADLTVSIDQTTGFNIHADASFLGLSSRFDGTIDDSGFSVSASQSLSVSLPKTATIDCCSNNCCLTGSEPWYEAAASDALCIADGYILSGCAARTHECVV